jgi:hypothetical protein
VKDLDNGEYLFAEHTMGDVALKVSVTACINGECVLRVGHEDIEEYETICTPEEIAELAHTLALVAAMAARIPLESITAEDTDDDDSRN